MANIQKISFTHVGRKDGCTCDRCGHHITNIYTVRFSDGQIVSFCTKCFGKLQDGKLSDCDKKVMRKAIKSLAVWTNIYEAEKKLTEETDEAWKYLQRPFSWESKSYWYGRDYSEYHEWMLTSWYAERFKEVQKEIDRFSKVDFDI